MEDGESITFIFNEKKQLKIEESIMNFFVPNWKFNDFIDNGPLSLNNH